MVKRGQPSDAESHARSADNLWEFGACPLCRSDKGSRVIYGFAGRSGRFSLPPMEKSDPAIVRCNECGLCYLYPRPAQEAMHRVYSSAGYFDAKGRSGYADYRSQEGHLRATFRRFLKVLQSRGLTGGALADIGCGLGYLLDEARPFFVKCVGTDMSRAALRAASEFGYTVVCGGPQELLATWRRFDLVTAIGVLEHVYEPVDFLLACSRLNRDGGSVIIVTPDIEGLWRKLLRRHWPSFKLPEHIAFYEQRTLALLAARAGMEIIDCFPFHQVFPLRLVLAKLGLEIAEKAKGSGLPILLPHVMQTVVFGRKETAQ